MDQALDEFNVWFILSGGSIHPSAEIVSTSSGITLRVKQDAAPIEPGGTIVSTPLALTLSYGNAKLSTSLQPLVQAGESAINQVILLRFFLIEQYLLKDDSFWWPYLQILPHLDDKDAMKTPMWYDEEDFEWVAGTNLGNAASARKTAWRQEYTRAMELLDQGNMLPSQDIWTWKSYIWAATILTSRSFPASALSDSEADSPVLIPGLDLLNHSPSAKVVWQFDTDACNIKTDEIVDAGSEIFNNYGPKSNEELLMGYGFTIPNNQADHFGLGFNATVSTTIHEVKWRRRVKTLDGSERVKEVAEGPDDQAISEQHWLCLKQSLSQGDNADIRPHHEFSPQLLEHFSITIENRRERKGEGCHWAKSANSLTPSNFNRNKFHVMTSMIMLLEQSLHNIRANEDKLVLPKNDKQVQASIYRQGQLNIVESTLAELRGYLQNLLQMGPMNGVLQLNDILTLGPNRFAHDLRNLLLVALGTRDEKKIRELRGEECAFTMWFCGLYVIRDSIVATHDSPFVRRLASWLEFLKAQYDWQMSDMMPPYRDRQPPRVHLEDSDVIEIACSYVLAVRAAVMKHPNSIFASPIITERLMIWFIEIVREVGMRVPHPDSEGKEQNDELVLFLEERA